MAQAEFREVLPVEKDKFFETVTRYEDYPKFVEGCHSVKVERKGPGRARVTYHISVMSQDIAYTLDHEEDAEKGTVRWSLVESGFFKKNTGYWEIVPAGKGRSDVRYNIEIEFKIPVPGFIMNRLVKGSLPSMVKSFQDQTLKKA